MKALVIVNKVAAKAQIARLRVVQELTAAGVSFDLYETTSAGDATKITREALKSGTTTIAVIGGDGTLSETAEGFFEFNHDVRQLPTAINREASLAILPAGTGDDFARGVRGRRTPLEDWIAQFIQHLQSGRPADHMVDVLYGRCDNYQRPFICLNASTMGIGGQTAGRVAAQGSFMRRFPGELRFAVAAVRALAVWRERRVEVTVDDGVVVDGPMNLAAVANARYAGGGMLLSPDARNDDGKLDVVTASGLSRTGVVRELSRIHTGGHINNPKVGITQGEVVRVHTFSDDDSMPLEVDGNVRGVTPVQFQVMARVLRFVQ
jgi:diacylglycerol kinase (ATP)